MKFSSRQRKRALLVTVLLVLLADPERAFCGAATRPEIIKFPTGIEAQFVAVTYGTNHVLNGTPDLVTHLPRQVTSSIPGAPPIVFQTDSPALIVWFHTRTDMRNVLGPLGGADGIVARLTDENGWEAGEVARVESGPVDGYILAGPFKVLPRRSRKLSIRLLVRDFHYYTIDAAIGSIGFDDPAYGSFPQWQAETLPVVRRLDGLDVRLDSNGVLREGGSGIHGSTAADEAFAPMVPGEIPEHLATFVLSFHPVNTNADWMLENAELSDATGNVMPGNLGLEVPIQDIKVPITKVTTNQVRVATLWPNEDAWKLSVHFKRAAHFDSNDLVMFTNVPVPRIGASTSGRITNSLAGVPIVLSGFVRRPDRNPPTTGDENYYRISQTTTLVTFECPVWPGNHVPDIVSVRALPGDIPVDFGVQNLMGERSIFLWKVPAETRAIDITWVVQKTQTLEFLVKPPVPNAR